MQSNIADIAGRESACDVNSFNDVNTNAAARNSNQSLISAALLSSSGPGMYGNPNSVGNGG